MKEIILIIICLLSPINAFYGHNPCVLFHPLKNLIKKCDGYDMYVERNFTNACAFEECPDLGINPASVGDSYNGAGICWDHPQWKGDVNYVNIDLSPTSPNRWIPECWWFGPDGTMNRDDIDTTDSVDCNAEYSDESERLNCWCRQPVWESGTIAAFDGVSMLSACCACGGGLDYDPEIGPPTGHPTIPPSPIPTSSPTLVTVPEGQTAHYYSLDYVESTYNQDMHGGSYFTKIVHESLAQVLELLWSDIHIVSIGADENGGVLINFYLLDGDVDPIGNKESITRSIYDQITIGGYHTIQAYQGFSTAAMESGDARVEPEPESNVARSLTFGIASGIVLLMLGLVGFTFYKKKKGENAASRFVFRAGNV